MARVVLPVFGAAVGAFFGSPQLGWAIGSLVGNAIDPQVIKGPSVGDISQQTAQEGGPRPIVFGLSQPIAGNIIATGEPNIVRTQERQGKGGPKVETESVYRTYAIGVCEGPIVAFIRVWRNGILVYDARLGSTPENNAFLEKARFFLGTYDQNPSPDLEGIFGASTPAHRGTAYMVVANDDLTDMRGAIPQYQFQVASTAGNVVVYSNEVLHPWAPSGLAFEGYSPLHPLNTYSVGIHNTGWLPPFSDLGLFTVSGGPWTSVNEALAALNARWSSGSNQDGRSYSYLIGYSRQDNAIGDESWLANAQDGAGPAVDDIYPNEIKLHFSPWAVDYVASESHYNSGGFSGNFYAHLFSHIGSSGRMYQDDTFAADTGGIVWTMGSGAQQYAQKYLTNSSFVTQNPSGTTQAGATGVAQLSVTRFPGPPTESAELVSGSFKVLQQFDNSPLRRPLNPCIESGSEDDTEAFWLAHYNEAVADGTMEAGLTYGVDYPVSQSWAYKLSASAVAERIPLADIIEEICERATLTAIDVSEIDSLTYGFTITNQYPAYAALQALSQVYFFDPCSEDAVVKFIPRGQNSVATITEAEMVDDYEDIEQETRTDPIVIPRVLHINYFDVNGGITTDKQSSERSGDRRSVGESTIQSAVIMDADEAARVVAINHKVGIEDQKGELRISLPDSFIGLTPGRNVILQYGGKSVRCRITQCDILEGYQQYRLLRDRQSAYTSNVEGIPASTPSPPPSSIPGPTLLEILDIPLLRDSEDGAGLGYYVAIGGMLAAWNGAVVELSYDGGQNYVDSARSSLSAVIGELVSPLNDHPQEFPDEVNSCEVRINTLYGELQETDLAGMMNRQNMAVVGNELIQFSNADETSEGTWSLSGFLRGRKATATESHPIGTRFVLLDRGSLNFVPAELADLGRTLTFRATSYGTSVDSGTVVSVAFRGESQSERKAAYLQAYRDGTDLVISWQGVGRLGAGNAVAHGAYFVGYRVTLTDGSTTESVDTISQTLTHDVSGFAGPITVTVEQRNQLTGYGDPISLIV